jgi:hypothetical protein
VIGQTSLRRYALKQAIKVAKDPNIDPAIKGQLIQQMSDTAVAAPAVPTPAYGRLVYRLIAIALGLVAILSVVFSFVLLLGQHKVDSAFYTLGSAAVGALGGVFSPQNASAEGRPGAGDAGAAAGGPGAGAAGGPGAGAAGGPGAGAAGGPGAGAAGGPGAGAAGGPGAEAAGGPGAGAAGGPGAGAAGGPGAEAAGGPGAEAAGGPGAEAAGGPGAA